MDWPSQRAQERPGSGVGTMPPGRPRPLIEGVGLAIGKHGGVATASGVVLVESPEALCLTPDRPNVLGSSAARDNLCPVPSHRQSRWAMPEHRLWRRVATIVSSTGR